MHQRRVSAGCGMTSRGRSAASPTRTPLHMLLSHRKSKMKRLLSAMSAVSLLTAASFPSASQASTPKTFSGTCFLRYESNADISEHYCVVSTNSTGLYGGRDQAARTWNVVIEGNTKTVICKEDGSGMLIKPARHPAWHDKEYRWHGTCIGRKLLGFYYINFETDDGLYLAFPQYG